MLSCDVLCFAYLSFRLAAFPLEFNINSLLWPISVFCLKSHLSLISSPNVMRTSHSCKRIVSESSLMCAFSIESISGSLESLQATFERAE